VQDLQHKLSDTSSKLAQEASRAASLESKEAFVEKELARARARGQELMGECQELEKEAARARKEHATLRSQAADASALLVREKAQAKELEERVARTASEAAAAASEAQERLDALLLRHAREVKSLTGREELLRNLIVHAEAQIDRLSAELYGDDYERAPLWPSDLALPGRSSPLTSGSVASPEATDHLRAWQVSDLVDRLVQLEEALVHVHCVSTPSSASLARGAGAVQGEVGKGGGGGGHNADRGEVSSAREEWVLSEKSTAAVAMAAELTGFRHKVTLLEEELADATRKLAAKDTLRKKNMVAEERLQVLSGQLLAVTEEHQELSRSYRVLCAKFAQASTAAQRDARQTSRADRDPSARTRGWSGRSPEHQHSRAHALSDSDEGAQQDAARTDFSLTGTAERGRSRHMDEGDPSFTEVTHSSGVGDGEDGGSQSEGASGEDSALDIDALYVSTSGGRAIVVEGRGRSEQDGGVRRGVAGIVVKSNSEGLVRGRSLPSRRVGEERDRKRGRGDGVTSEQYSIQAVLAKGRVLLEREREQKGGEGERGRRGMLRALAQRAGVPAQLDRQSPRSHRGASGWVGAGYTKEGDIAWIEGKVRRLQAELDAFLADGGGEVSGMGVGALRDLQVPLVACPSAFCPSHHTSLHYRLFSWK
jgi:hypothetical protein